MQKYALNLEDILISSFDMTIDCDKLISDFSQVCLLSGVGLSNEQVKYEVLSKPHKPASLPKGWMAVYVFYFEDHCLKVGKVGVKSSARFTSQHYHPYRSKSNLAKSILSYENGQLPCSFDLSNLFDKPNEIGSWMLKNTSRLHFFLREDVDKYVLGLLEAFVQCRLSPIFEG